MVLGSAGESILTSQMTIDFKSEAITTLKTGQNWDPPQSVPRKVLTEPRQKVFPAGFQTSGLEPFLPAATTSHLILPLYAAETPILVMIATSSRGQILPADIAAMRSVGSILKARLLQDRVVQSDLAKNAFLSSISHELRTPMHSMLSGVGLARAAADINDLDEVRSALEDVSLCGHTLKKIVNDVLDFGKPTIEAPRTRITKVDLSRSVREASATCLPLYQDLLEDFSLVLELQQRDWNVYIDDGKFRRYVRLVALACRF